MADQSMAVSLSCPVCFEDFSSSAGASFALHVASCTCSSPPPPVSPSAAHCLRCLHVYATDALAHEISFHEHECARVNDLPDEDTEEETDTSSTSGHKNKRQRNGGTRVVATPRVSLFPSSCFLCGNSGRGLLHCGGSCARSAHQNCVDQLQAPSVGNPLSVAERRQVADQWKCAQCLRGVHRCASCGFLGHARNGMRKCAVLDCGYHFHEHCRPNTAAEQDEMQSLHADFVCPRHTCMTCGTQETDMRRCKSCFMCFYMTHLRCPRGSGAAAVANGGGLEPTNLFECPQHDGETAASLRRSFDASNSLRLRLAAGDVVLVLEFDNALLPVSVKTAAPDAANHWGIVLSAVDTEPHGRGNQLLKVQMFADDNVLVMPNQYAMRIATMSDFSRPVDLIRYCLRRHVMVELQLRQMERNVDDTEAKRILRASNSAFAARLKALEVTPAQATGDAEQGLAHWRQFQDSAEPRRYDGLEGSAPSYLYIDTRGFCPGRQLLSSINTAEMVADVARDVDGDMPMTDADTDSNGAAANSSTRGSLDLMRPKSAEKSPNEAEAVCTSTLSSGAIDPVCANRNRRIADVYEGIDINSTKRPKLDTETPVHFRTAAFTPTNSRKVFPGAALSSASAPATLHISPLASRARTLFPHQLTRKQKVLADMPPLVLEELERKALRCLEEGDGLTLKSARVPPDADAFPWSARATNFLPAFYRPTAILGHSGLRRPGVDAVSRLLVSQDKRSIRCFVHTLEIDAEVSKCCHLNNKTTSVSSGFMLLDLLSLHSFRDLEYVVRMRLVEALGKRSRYTHEHFGMDAHQAQCWLEQQRHRKTSSQRTIALSYCTADGIRRHLDLNEASSKLSLKDMQTWLCFCANVCHVSVLITAPSVAHLVLTPITSVPRLVSAAK